MKASDLQVELTRAALAALDARSEPLYVEMELFFSCLIRKRLRWDCQQAAGEDALPVTAHNKLRVWFHPVVSQHCALPQNNDLSALPLTEFPLMRKDAFHPHWLRLDYRRGVFQGDFGW